MKNKQKFRLKRTACVKYKQFTDKELFLLLTRPVHAKLFKFFHEY
jgi:hypothetical protein